LNSHIFCYGKRMNRARWLGPLLKTTSPSDVFEPGVL
jgi:hypothetical protein